MTSRTLFIFVGVLTAGLSLASHADDPASKFASGPGTLVYIASGTLTPLFQDGSQGKENTARTMDALLTTTLLTEALKKTVREKRPDSEARTSFPSGHTSAAFAIATMQSHYHPQQALFWYAGAALIGISRVRLHRHYTHDVVAGAALGYFTSKWELHAKHGLILSPIIRGLGEGHDNSRSTYRMGLGIAGTF